MAENPMLQRKSSLRAILKRKTFVAQKLRKTKTVVPSQLIEVTKIIKKQGTWAPSAMMGRDLSTKEPRVTKRESNKEDQAAAIAKKPAPIKEEEDEEQQTLLITEIDDPRLKDIELTYPKEPSFKTIFAVINSILGSSILILPTLMKETGMITNLIVSFVIGLLSYHTCELYVIHVKDDEHDLHEVLNRLLGRKWQIIYGVFSGVFFNFILLVTYYLLMCNMIYPAITFMMQAAGKFY